MGKPGWWWWDGGAYLPNLQVWKGAGGIPIQNFLGWAEVTFVIVFIFDPGLVQAVMIGVFTTCPVIMLGVLKFAKDYWTAPSQ